MKPSACPAARLLEADRKDMAILALAGTATIIELAARPWITGVESVRKGVPGDDAVS
jgi:hypothetical protein